MEYRCLLGLKVQFSKTRPGRAPGAPTAHPAPSPETAGRATPSTAPSRPVLVWPARRPRSPRPSAGHRRLRPCMRRHPRHRGDHTWATDFFIDELVARIAPAIRLSLAARSPSPPRRCAHRWCPKISENPARRDNRSLLADISQRVDVNCSACSALPIGAGAR